MKEREGLRIIILRAILPLNSILLRGAVEEGPEVKRTVGDFVSLYFLKIYFFSLQNMTEDFSPKALVVVERLLELLG